MHSLFDPWLSLAIDHNTGLVEWVFDLQVKINCKMDFTFFPMDEHVCQYKTGTYGTNSSKIVL